MSAFSCEGFAVGRTYIRVALSIVLGVGSSVGNFALTAWSYTFNANGRSYPTARLPMPYYINSDYPPLDADQAAALQEAFQVWNDVPTAKVAWTYMGLTDTPQNNAGIIAFTGVAGYCTPTNIETINGNSYITAFSARIGNEGVCAQRHVLNAIAIHELGHAMGLGHSTDSTAIMYSTMNYYNPVTVLSADDIAGVTDLYPAGNGRPVARLTLSPVAGIGSVCVTFDASACYDVDGSINSYIYSFNDGSADNTTAAAMMTHVYTCVSGSDPTVYYPRLQVADD